MFFTQTLHDHYRTLGLGQDAKIEDIKKAFRTAALSFHPDRYRHRVCQESIVYKLTSDYLPPTGPDIRHSNGTAHDQLAAAAKFKVSKLLFTCMVFSYIFHLIQAISEAYEVLSDGEALLSHFIPPNFAPKTTGTNLN